MIFQPFSIRGYSKDSANILDYLERSQKNRVVFILVHKNTFELRKYVEL